MTWRYVENKRANAVRVLVLADPIVANGLEPIEGVLVVERGRCRLRVVVAVSGADCSQHLVQPRQHSVSIVSVSLRPRHGSYRSIGALKLA